MVTMSRMILFGRSKESRPGAKDVLENQFSPLKSTPLGFSKYETV